MSYLQMGSQTDYIPNYLSLSLSLCLFLTFVSQLAITVILVIDSWWYHYYVCISVWCSVYYLPTLLFFFQLFLPSYSYIFQTGCSTMMLLILTVLLLLHACLSTWWCSTMLCCCLPADSAMLMMLSAYPTACLPYPLLCSALPCCWFMMLWYHFKL